MSEVKHTLPGQKLSKVELIVDPERNKYLKFFQKQRLNVELMMDR